MVKISAVDQNQTSSKERIAHERQNSFLVVVKPFMVQGGQRFDNAVVRRSGMMTSGGWK